MLKATELGLISILFFAVCARDYNPKLVEYLKAEKDTRRRIAPAYLEDSIKVLQKKYHFDPEKELAILQRNPELWIKLIKELQK